MYHPSAFIRDEVEARGWSVTLFASIMRTTTDEANALLHGTKDLGEREAAMVAKAFGTSVGTWQKLQEQYDAHLGEEVQGG